MERSLDLLTRAVSEAKSERQLALDLGLESSALRKARERGNLSPEIAALLASRLGENVAFWTLRAVDEGSRHSTASRVIRKAADQVVAGGRKP
jgi:hypothetical protein